MGAVYCFLEPFPLIPLFPLIARRSRSQRQRRVRYSPPVPEYGDVTNQLAGKIAAGLSKEGKQGAFPLEIFYESSHSYGLRPLPDPFPNLIDHLRQVRTRDSKHLSQRICSRRPHAFHEPTQPHTEDS